MGVHKLPHLGVVPTRVTVVKRLMLCLTPLAIVEDRQGDALTPSKGNSVNSICGTSAAVHLGGSRSYVTWGLEG